MVASVLEAGVISLVVHSTHPLITAVKVAITQVAFSVKTGSIAKRTRIRNFVLAVTSAGIAVGTRRAWLFLDGFAGNPPFVMAVTAAQTAGRQIVPRSFNERLEQVL